MCIDTNSKACVTIATVCCGWGQKLSIKRLRSFSGSSMKMTRKRSRNFWHWYHSPSHKRKRKAPLGHLKEIWVRSTRHKGTKEKVRTSMKHLYEGDCLILPSRKGACAPRLSSRSATFQPQGNSLGMDEAFRHKKWVFPHLRLVYHISGLKQKYKRLSETTVCKINFEHCVSKTQQMFGYRPCLKHWYVRLLHASEYADHIQAQQRLYNYYSNARRILRNISRHVYITKHCTYMTASAHDEVIMDFAENNSFIVQDTPQS